MKKTGHKAQLSKWASLDSSQQGILLACRVSLGARPARKHKGNLVDKVCNVVDNVQERVVHGPEQVAEQVAKWVDRPAHCDNHTHVVEGCSNSLAATADIASGFTNKDLLQNEEPAAHSTNETRPSRDGLDLTTVSACKHHHGAEQKPPEHTTAAVLASCFQDQVELNHLERNSDAPVHVPVDNGGFMNLYPILAHVHVVHCCHQSDQSTHVHRCPPVGKESPCFCKEEHSGS